MRDRTYTFIYPGRTCDDENNIEYLTKEEIKKIVKEKKLTYWDYAIINGPILKSFHSKFSLEDL